MMVDLTAGKITLKMRKPQSGSAVH